MLKIQNIVLFLHTKQECMEKDLIQHSSFWYEETSLSLFREQPCHIEGGFIFFCIRGNAVISSGIQEYSIVKNSTTMFLSGMTFFIKSASEDFLVRLFTFSKELYSEIVLQLPPAFSQFMNETSAYEHEANSHTLKSVYVLMDMAKLVHQERNNSSANILQRNFLQTYMLYVFGYVQPLLDHLINKHTRRQRLFHRFISLVYTYCQKHRDVTFYANSLCISPRNLYGITFEYSSGLSPKQLIDKQFVLEIKALLASSDLTISEIAYKLNLPDQSYLCRYFKRHIGISPTEYRNQKNN